MDRQEAQQDVQQTVQKDERSDDDLMQKIVARELDTAFNSFKKRLDQVKHDPDFRIKSKNRVLKNSQG